MNYNKMKFSVGLFLVLFFTAVVVFGFFFLQKKGAFNHNYLYYTSSKSAIAFQIGMPVKYSGFNIGTISQLVLEETGEVSISILIDQNYQRFLTQESKLILKKPLIGSAHIELHRSANSTLLEEESYLPLSTSDDINDIVSKLEPVSDQLIKIVDNIETITSRIASEDSPLSKTLLNLEKFSNTLASNDSLLTTVTGDKEVTKTVSKALDSVYQTLKNIEDISQNLEKKVVDPSSQSVEHINTILEDVKQKLLKLDQTVNTVVELNPEIENIKKELEYTAIKSNELLDKIDTILLDKKQTLELP